ncbi:hypothetical protein BP5796_04137 [Coleophoma crateriformis]|uniref:FAD dependent oxidoreductase domain-containing protein n=1 Tax=Coleophoma crateriformis TaxID=565419 RepID=A0A3D8SHR2_9HELO|nr:hypothetical protein BP5796_04137 [Coleophoma crateriformis]
MSTTPFKERIVLIIGGGTFRTSIAYHLSQSVYVSVTVLDRWAPQLLEAKDPAGLFSGMFYNSGWIIGAGNATLPFMEASVKNSELLGFNKGEFVSAEQNKKAIEAIGAGVKHIHGDSGYVKQLLFDADSTCVGAVCSDGSVYFADVIILATGAAAAGLLDMKGQLVAEGYTVGYVQLTPDEVERYKNIPIVDHLDNDTDYKYCIYGIMFPPNEDGIIKFGTVRFCTNLNCSIPGV